MRVIQNSDGHVGLTRRNYRIAKNTSIPMGAVVKLSGGLVVLAAANETGTILGVAGENHPGTPDALNLRADGEEILVYDNPGAIMECDVPVFTATGGTATTVTAADTNVACTTADKFNGGVLVLKEKANGSGNTDAPKTRKAIADYALSSNVATFTVASGAAAAAGDKFELYPPIGATGWGGLNTDRSAMVASATGCTMLKCIGHDYDRHKIRLIAVQAELGVEN